ncbi:hypothetical protein VTI28DRAFT_7555 [Corynascus sepedonium]
MDAVCGGLLSYTAVSRDVSPGQTREEINTEGDDCVILHGNAPEAHCAIHKRKDLVSRVSSKFAEQRILPSTLNLSGWYPPNPTRKKFSVVPNPGAKFAEARSSRRAHLHFKYISCRLHLPQIGFFALLRPSNLKPFPSPYFFFLSLFSFPIHLLVFPWNPSISVNLPVESTSLTTETCSAVGPRRDSKRAIQPAHLDFRLDNFNKFDPVVNVTKSIPETRLQNEAGFQKAKARPKAGLSFPIQLFTKSAAAAFVEADSVTGNAPNENAGRRYHPRAGHCDYLDTPCTVRHTQPL